MKTLVWDRGSLIPVNLHLHDILRLCDDEWWNAVVKLNVYDFWNFCRDYLNELFGRCSRISLDNIIGEMEIGEYEGNLVTVNCEGKFVFVHLHRPNAKELVLYSLRYSHTPTIVEAGKTWVKDSFGLANEFWRVYAQLLWGELRSQTDYVASGDAIFIDVAIRDMMQWHHMETAEALADCAFWMAMAKGDAPMADYFSRIRDGIAKALLTN